MKVYLLNEMDWINFVTGKYVVAFIEPLENYYKGILVAFNEVVSIKSNEVTIIKKF